MKGISVINFIVKLVSRNGKNKIELLQGKTVQIGEEDQMIKNSFFKKAASLTLSVIMLSTLVLPNVNIGMFDTVVAADNLPVISLGSGSIGSGSNSSEAAKLPRTNTQGTYRYTTDTYNSNHAALDTTDYASSWLWSYGGSMDIAGNGALSGTAYPLPLALIMKKDGLRITKPPMLSFSTNIAAYITLDNDNDIDFKIYPDWTITSNNVDEVTDWSYEAIASNGNKKMRTTMTQGSPFTFLELTNSNVLYLEKMRVTFPSSVVYDTTYNGARMLVVRTNDITSSVNGYPGLSYQYYAMFLPQGASVDYQGTSDSTGNDGIGIRKITLPTGKTYASFAWICESQSINDSNAISIAKSYRPYAFNFITNTVADYRYDEASSILYTTYTYSFDKKSESTADGTVMGILPHQYKNMNGYSFLSNQAVTIRGYMKFLMGSSYTTTMKYNGILPYMPSLPDSDTAGRAQLQAYVDDFVNTKMQGSGNWTLSNDQGNDTYWHGKKLNRSAQVVAAAKSIGDEESAEIVLEGLKANLEEWFTYSGANDKSYFTYLGEGVGVLLGFPSSFNAVDQFNDHHFHYGYFIQAAACVGLWDKEWLEEYKDVIKQLIYDIASPYRNQNECVSDCGNAYPYLRCFSPYEGHSWASGYQDERTGNNQESTSEAINAWAGITLFGEVLGDDELRDLGIYLYTTEIAAADNYWFDIDEDIYSIGDSKYEPPMAAMVWGGKVDYATYFGLQYSQGIHICPMQSWSFYFLNGGENISGEDYIQKFIDYDMNGANSNGGSVNLWNDMWAQYYALKDPSYAMNTLWKKDSVNDGESKAHTYHYIQSLVDYGTPDLSFTASSPMTSVFKKNGKYTYAVYNSTNTIENVTFTSTSGSKVKVKAKPNGLTLFNSDDIGKLSYNIEYYGENLDGNGYTKMDTDIKYAAAGSKVTAIAKDFTGYQYNSSSSNNELTGTVNSDGTLVLKVYYNRGEYTVSYDLVGGTKSDAAKYPTGYTYGENYELDSPIRQGYDFYGWYLDAAYGEKVESISKKYHDNLTLYAKWIPEGTILINEDAYLTFDTNTNGTFTIIGDTQYDAVNVLYKISDTVAEAKELADSKAEEGFVSWGLDAASSGWTRTEDFKSRAGKYITFYFIRYDDNGGYKTDYAYGYIGKGSVDTPIETTSSPVGETGLNWSGISYAGDGAGGGTYSNKYKFYCANDKVSLVNIQNGFETEPGLYVTFPTGISSCSLGTDAYYIQGAGILLHLSAFTLQETQFTVTDATGTYTCYVYYADGKGSNIDNTVKPEETTTVKPEETTTNVSGFNKGAVNEWALAGNWGVYYGDWSGTADVSYKYISDAEYHLHFNKANKGAAWLVQSRYDVAAIAGHRYRVTVSVTTDKAGSIGIKEDLSNGGTNPVYTDIPVGTTVITGEYTVEQDKMRVMFELGQGIDTGTTLTFSDITIEDITGTEADTTIPSTETTTVAEETTSKGTTVGGPIEVFGIVGSSKSDNTVTVVWGQNAEQIENGQKYNIYVGDELKLSNVACGEYTITDIPAGTYTVKVTAVLNGVESVGASVQITVIGATEIVTTTEAPTEKTTDVTTDEYGCVVSEDLEINGYQISTTNQGTRTIYSVENTVNQLAVTEVGLVYGLSDYASANDMYVGSGSDYVKAYAAQVGRLDGSYGTSDTASSYAMTMLFAAGTKNEFSTTFMIRVYAKLSDGSYVYSNLDTYSIYEVAKELYDGLKMNTYDGHVYLYENILTVVDPAYAEKNFNWGNTVVNP